MFADNQRISRRQLSCQVLLGLSGAFLMTMPTMASLGGWSGLIGAALGVLLLWIFLFFLVRTTAVARGLKERLGTRWYSVIACFYLSYLVLSGGYLVNMTSEMISYVLLPQYHPWVIGGIFVLAALLGTGGELQRRGRLGEVSCFLVTGGLGLLVVLAAFQIEPEEMVMLMTRMETPAVSEIANSAYQMFCSFSIIGLLPFLMHRVERSQSSWKYLCASTGIAAALGIGAVFVMQFLFGFQGTQRKIIPITSLMAAVNVPGGFCDRFDAVWMFFLLFALLYSAGTVFYYGQHLIGWKTSVRVRVMLGISVFAAAFFRVQGYTVLDVYPWCVRWIYVPVFVVFGLSLSRIRRKL